MLNVKMEEKLKIEMRGITLQERLNSSLERILIHRCFVIANRCFLVPPKFKLIPDNLMILFYLFNGIFYKCQCDNN
jgi:hypothetical protein